MHSITNPTVLTPSPIINIATLECAIPLSIDIPVDVPVVYDESSNYCIAHAQEDMSDLEFPCAKCSATRKRNPLYKNGRPKPPPSIVFVPIPEGSEFAENPFTPSERKKCDQKTEYDGTPMALMPFDLEPTPVLTTPTDAVQNVLDRFKNPVVRPQMGWFLPKPCMHIFWRKNDTIHSTTLDLDDFLLYIQTCVEIDTVGPMVELPCGMIKYPSQEEVDRLTKFVNDHQKVIAFVEPTYLLSDVNDGDDVKPTVCSTLVFYKTTGIKRDVPLDTWKIQRSHCVCKPCALCECTDCDGTECKYYMPAAPWISSDEDEEEQPATPSHVPKMVRGSNRDPRLPATFTCFHGIPENDKCEQCQLTATQLPPPPLASREYAIQNPYERLVIVDTPHAVVSQKAETMARTLADMQPRHFPEEYLLKALRAISFPPLAELPVSPYALPVNPQTAVQARQQPERRFFAANNDE